MARIFEWKFLLFSFFTMYSSIGSRAMCTLNSVALEKLSLCERGVLKQVVWFGYIQRITNITTIHCRIVIPSGCFHLQGHQGHTLYQHPLFLGLKYRLGRGKKTVLHLSVCDVIIPFILTFVLIYHACGFNKYKCATSCPKYVTGTNLLQHLV